MRVLSFDGGGYLGLAPASFLAGIEHHFDKRCSDQFDLYCGTSTGAILALAFAIGKTAGEVTSLYEAFGASVFKRWRRWGGAIRQVFGAQYDNKSLKSVLRAEFGDRTLGDLRDDGRRILVVAYNLTAGRPVIFKTDHSDRLSNHDSYLLREIALASCAAPVYFPIVPLENPVTGVKETFCDGGIVANSPALLGFTEATYELGSKPEEVSILSIQTPRTDLAEHASALKPTQRTHGRGVIGWDMGRGIFRVALDGTSVLSHQLLLRIAKLSGTRYVRIEFSAPEGVGLDIATARATQTLRQLGADKARQNDIRTELKDFFF